MKNLNLKTIKDEIKKEIQLKCEIDNNPLLPFEIVDFTFDYIIKEYLVILQKNSKIENIQLLQLKKDDLIKSKKTVFKLAVFELSEMLGSYMKCAERVVTKDGGLQKDLDVKFILSFIPVEKE
jgi:hypothetical protein